MDKRVFMCFNKNDQKRRKSSSGGIFPLLSEVALDNGGVVYGAAFDDHFNVVHKRISKKTETDSLMGSKYVQSSMLEIFEEIEKDLLDNKTVLFSGTQCHVAAINSYLKLKKTPKDTFFTVEVVCHGVPSKKSFRSWINSVSNATELKEIQFCNKERGWNRRSILISYDNKKYFKPQKDDNYMKMFVKDISLRPSCYECQFKNFKSKSDITIGDFWGYNDFRDEDNKEAGCSLVIVNTEKGQELFSAIQDDIVSRRSTLEIAITGNPYLVKPAKMNKNRDLYFRLLNSKLDYRIVTLIVRIAELINK